VKCIQFSIAYSVVIFSTCKYTVVIFSTCKYTVVILVIFSTCKYTVVIFSTCKYTVVIFSTCKYTVVILSTCVAGHCAHCLVPIRKLKIENHVRFLFNEGASKQGIARAKRALTARQSMCFKTHLFRLII